MQERVFSKAIIIITAYLCIVLSLVVMCGWIFHLPELVQLTPQSVPVHFNTALSFFLFGIALFCLLYLRFLTFTFFLGLIIACIGAITFSEDVFAFKAGFDDFFVADFILTQTPSPGRMSPNTAAPFFLEGFLIAALACRPKKKWVMLSLKLLAIVVFCFGFTSFFGYLLDIETAYAWGHLTAMSLPSAIIFCLSGISLILLAYGQAKSSGIVTEKSYPYLAGTLFFFQSILLSIAIEGEQNKHIDEFLDDQVVEIKNVITNSIHEQGNILRRNVARWESREKTPYNEWLLDAQNTINDLPGWQYMFITDEHLKIKWVAPDTLSDTLLNKQLIEQIHLSKDTHTPMLTFIQPTSQKELLILSFPMYKKGVFKGIEAVGIQPDAFLEQLLSHQISYGFFVKASIDGQVIFSSSNVAEARFDFEKTQELTLYALPLTVKVYITETLLRQIVLSKASYLVLGIGIVLAILLTLYVQAFQKIQMHLYEVEKNEERFRLASKATNDILLDWNCRDDQFLMSENIKLFGYSPQSIQYSRKWWFEHVHPDDQIKLSDSIKNCLYRKLPFWSYEYRFARSDGSYANILDRAYILYNEDGQPVRAIGAMVDITERKAIEQRKNEFISTVSHELRTPLTSIKGSLGLLLANAAGPLSEKAVQLLQISSNNCDRLVRMISSILDIEKIESNRGEFAFKPLDIVELVRESVQTNDTYAKIGIQMLITPQIASGLVFADHDRLRQVMDNLLSNAIKFSPHGKSITISIERIKNNIRVSVSDEGEGIPIEFQKRIFEKFARADSSTSRLQGGTGLGLSISKAIIERHKGTIGFVAREPKGTTFYFELPELKEVKEESKTGGGLLQETSKKALHVLICEDDIDFAHVLKLLLEKEGASVEIAHTAAQAKALLNSKKFDLLTLDLALPDQDGMTLTQELRQDERTRTLPIIVISYTGAETEEMLRKKPFSVLTCLDKPFSLNDLKTIIEKVPRQSDALKGPMRILHVEDEKDILDVVKTLLGKEAHIEQAMTIKEAKKKLASESFDLVLLDIRLPDGTGLSLLPCKDYKTQSVIPTIIFSASQTPIEYTHFVTVSLLKSEVSNEKLATTVRTILQKARTL